MLDLSRNHIDAKEIKYLAQTLRDNTVRHVFFFYTKYLSLFLCTDIDHTQSFQKPIRRRRSKILV